MREELTNKYFDWLYSLVYSLDEYASEPFKHTKLLRYLYNVPFYSSIPRDENRIADGISLRYEFGYQFGYSDHDITVYLDSRQCSVLEVMVGLASRCEKQIMADDNYGDRTGQWFDKMIRSLGLSGMTNQYFNEDAVSRKIKRFLNHDYEPNGKGGLFTVKNSPLDMRTVELWVQLCAFLNEYLHIDTH